MPIYLDYNATTPMDPRVFEAMKPYFLEEFGNAGSRTHVFGQRAKEAVEHARSQVGAVLGAKPDEIVFTSGATESNNLALLGLAKWGERNGRRHIVTSAIEHKAVLEPLEQLRESGFDIEHVPVARGGYVDHHDVVRRVRQDTLLVSLMHSNNETGVLQPIRDVAAGLAGKNIFFHIDAAQTFGKEIEALRDTRCDFISISGHKIYGPKGIGALYARRAGAQKRPITPLLHGGGQEMGMRPGTLPVPLIVGLGAAAELAQKEHRNRAEKAHMVKERWLAALSDLEHRVNGDRARSQPHVLNVCFLGVDSEALMVALRDVMAISNGSACTSSSYSPSHVLRAMGLTDEEVSSSIRISWGPGVEEAALPTGELVAAVNSLKC